MYVHDTLCMTMLIVTTRGEGNSREPNRCWWVGLIARRAIDPCDPRGRILGGLALWDGQGVGESPRESGVEIGGNYDSQSNRWCDSASN